MGFACISIRVALGAFRDCQGMKLLFLDGLVKPGVLNCGTSNKTHDTEEMAKLSGVARKSKPRHEAQLGIYLSIILLKRYERSTSILYQI